MQLLLSNIKYKDASARLVTVNGELTYEDGYIITMRDYTYKFITLEDYDKLLNTIKDEVSEGR